MNLNYNHHTLSVECGEGMPTSCILNCFQSCSHGSSILGILHNPCDGPCVDTVMFWEFLREFLETNPKNDLVLLMGKLVEILAKVREKCHANGVPKSWGRNLWREIGIGEYSFLKPLRKISGLEVGGDFSSKLQLLVKSLTENKPMEVLQVMLADFYSMTPIIV